MNYIQEINAFYDWLQTNQLSKSAIALWHTLMHINNKTGWSDRFTVATSILEYNSGFKRSEIFKGRNELAQKGRIKWFARGGNLSAEYQIIGFCVHNTDANGNTNGNANGNTNGTQTVTINKLNKTKQNVLLEKEPKCENKATSKKTKPKIPDFEEFWEYGRDYLLKIGKTPVDGFKIPTEAKYNSWKEAGWIDGKGNKISNWKTKLQNTIIHLSPVVVNQSQNIDWKYNFLREVDIDIKSKGINSVIQTFPENKLAFYLAYCLWDTWIKINEGSQTLYQANITEWYHDTLHIINNFHNGTKRLIAVMSYMEEKDDVNPFWRNKIQNIKELGSSNGKGVYVIDNLMVDVNNKMEKDDKFNQKTRNLIKTILTNESIKPPQEKI
ncbi:hypothetical protein PG616_01085 [Riemerella anatipestifer]|nr:hypothetical protein [Riemerella anatipestifer]